MEAMAGRRARRSLGVDGFGRPYGEHESGSMILEPGSRDITLYAAGRPISTWVSQR